MKRLLLTAAFFILASGSLTTYAVENENIQISENVVEEPAKYAPSDWIYTISWRTEGDTIVVTGEGPIAGNSLILLKLQMDNVKHIRFENCKIIGSMQGLFMGMDNLESIDFTGLDTSQVTDMSNLFYGCTALKSLNLSGFNTFQVTKMDSMFQDCVNLENLDLSNFDTSHTTNMFAMFRGCSALKSLNISNFDMSLTLSGYMYMLDGCTPALIRTPKALDAREEIILSGTYCTPEGVTTDKITGDFLSTVLIRMPENIDITNGILFAVHEDCFF